VGARESRGARRRGRGSDARAADACDAGKRALEDAREASLLRADRARSASRLWTGYRGDGGRLADRRRAGEPASVPGEAQAALRLAAGRRRVKRKAAPDRRSGAAPKRVPLSRYSPTEDTRQYHRRSGA